MLSSQDRQVLFDIEARLERIETQLLKLTPHEHEWRRATMASIGGEYDAIVCEVCGEIVRLP